ncbi:MAG: ribonuclease H-like domain-containing protein [Desulfotignum sp.]|nr:ribonuclease H-like domain-containing protein [Desulfotignum sp.]
MGGNMLTNSFIHIPGVGAVTEKRLWTAGLLDWHQVDAAGSCDISARSLTRIAACMAESCEHLDKNNPAYFAAHLPAGEHWRFFPQFRKTTAFIDIETTGMDMFGSEITTIALYDGESIKYYVQGQNLDAFMDDIEKYNVIVTYNGKTFDVPFIEKYFCIRMNHAHIDLRYVLKSLGYGGGLKMCEKALGLDRGDLDGVDGFFAVLLWREFAHTGNIKALETLLAYNIEDVVNLETLMVTAYNMKLKDTPFSRTHALPLPEIPDIPFKPDLSIIERIRQRCQFF